jgi:hypothetical protein
MAAALTITVAAQQTTPATHASTCVTVKTGQDAAFDQVVNGDLHKFEQTRVDSGALSGYIVLRTVMPAGKAADCDYVFLSFYAGMPKAPMTDEDITAALQKAGSSMSREQFGQKLSQVGEMVSNSLTYNVDLVGGAQKGDYIVYNSMKVSEGNIDNWIKWEKTMWGPLAQSMVKSGQLSGWAMDIQIFPRGAKDKGLESTSDIYPSWDAFVQARDHYEAGWKATHPNDDMMTAMDQLGKLCTIEHTVLYKVVDEIMAK